MSWEDPAVWILIGAIVVFLFGANKIPGLAKALGQARKEFDNAAKGITTTNATVDSNDPLVVAAQKEGIDTVGKTREQIASEISWKLSKK